MFRELSKLRPLFSRRDKLLYLGLLLLMVGGAIFELFGIGSVPAFVAALAVPDQVMAHPVAASLLHRFGITTSKSLLIWGCFGLGLVFLLKNCYLAFQFDAQIRITEIHQVRLADRLFRAYMDAPYEFHLKHNSAELLRNVQAETREIATGIINPMLNIVMGGLITLFAVGLLVVVMPPIVMAIVGVVIAASWSFLRAFRKRLQRYGVESMHERKESIKAVNQGLGALVETRLLGTVGYFKDAFHRSIAQFATLDRLRQSIAKSAPLVMETIAALGLLALTLALVWSGAEVASMLPTLALFGAAVMRLRASVGQIIAGSSQIHYSVPSISTVVSHLAQLEPARCAAVASTRDRCRLALEDSLILRNVSYRYPGRERPALVDVTLTIRNGERVALVGATGSGKSTLVNVILGLLPPSSGKVTVDGISIHNNLAGWQANIGYVPQSIFLLDDTIRRNVAFGLADRKIDEDKLRRAIRTAQLETFVASLRADVETVVGERGIRLSGGQRQRIGLARALYHEPLVLVLDEATSALDNKTEQLFSEALKDISVCRTLVIVAHRLSTVRDCDRLYFLRDGHVEASGSYEELKILHSEFRRIAEVV